MDFLYFLKKRTNFLRKHYETAVAPFEAIRTAINDHQPPFDQPDPNNSDYEEPDYLQEWMEADDSAELIGRSCLSFLSATLKLFFESTCESFCDFHNQTPPQGKMRDGFVPGYQEWFKANGIDFEQSGVDLKIIGELPLARNRSEHHDFLPEMAPSMNQDYAEKFPLPFFIHPGERRVLEDEGQAANSFTRIRVTREPLLRAIAEVEKLCEFITAESARKG